jgi:gliding motility-associated-like protein
LIRHAKRYFFVFQFCLGLFCFSQNETKKWYFGNQAGLDFVTTPPTILTNGVMNTVEGCSSISNAAGNLLFYTNGINVWDQTHAIMANGSGLNGNPSSTQTGAILKKPGSSTLYYIFSQQGQNTFGGGCYYSIVDMSLASGNGSVTTKNISLYQPSAEKMVATRHCNGVDFWIITRDANTSNFRAFLLTSAGVSTAVVTSTANTPVAGFSGAVGYLKVSPNGRKLANAAWNNGLAYEIYDFDNSTGVISNPVLLGVGFGLAYGCEFSPDGTKFYGGVPYNTGQVYQWDLCAGSATAIAASIFTVQGVSAWKGAFQLASDGKIYISRYNTSTLAVINNPNLSGSSCGYVELGQSISPSICQFGLPNFITSALKTPPPPFTFTVSNAFGCQTGSFTAPPTINNFSLTNCAASGYSLTGMLWNFGDPLSGANNTSTLSNPPHAFTNLGSYTVNLVLYYTCGGGTDTLKQVVNVTQPCISVSSNSITCASLGSATVQATGGTGPFSYTWMPTGQTTSVATGLSPGTYTIRVFDFGNNFTYTANTSFSSLIPLTGMLVNSSSLTCFGATNGTAAIVSLSGGSGNQSYLWTNGVNSYTAPNPQNLSAGNYTYTVTDALTGCLINGGFFISQPPALNLNIAAASPSFCAGSSVALTGTASGGSPFMSGSGYNYNWIAGPAAPNYTTTQSQSGTYVYTLMARDTYSCAITQTVSIDVIANPTLVVSSSFICPLQTGTLSAFGASTFTWNGLYSGISFTDNPLATTIYTVVGSTLGCSSAATGSIVLKTVPVPTLSTNGPRCNGSLLVLNGTGGVNYLWRGPASFSSTLQTITINPVGLVNAGVYNLTVTAANGCTASVSNNLIVYPTPTLSAAGSTVCSGQTASLIANSVVGASFSWSGPLSYTSNIKNSFLNNAILGQSGSYNVIATSVNGCTNSAIALVNIVSPPLPLLTFNSSSICAQALNGSSNVNTANCSGASTYTLIAPGYISVSNANAVSPVLTVIPPFTAGLATHTLIGSNGICAVSTTASFSIIANPTVVLSSTHPTICAGQSSTINAQGANNYFWGQTSADITTYNGGAFAVVLPGLTVFYTVYGSSAGCNSATQNQNITVNPIPVVMSAPLSASICLNEQVVLGVIGNATSYSWSPSIGLNTSLGSSVIASPSSDQNYYITASLNSCTNVAIIPVYVKPLPIPAFSLTANTVCLNDTFTAKGYGGFSYVWKDPYAKSRKGETVSFIANNVSYSGVYTLLVTDEVGCEASTSFSINVIQLPNGILSSTQFEACAPFCSDFKFSSSNALNTVWTLNGKSYNNSDFTACFNLPGEYRIYGNLFDQSTGCSNTQSYLVKAWSAPEANFEFNPISPIENGDEVVFTNTSKGLAQNKWNWFFINNFNYKSDRENAAYRFQDAGTYPITLMVTNQWGCSDTLTKLITVEPDFFVFVPNAFTPNEDGLNELFQPVLRGVKNFEWTIYNRWGNKVFESNDFQAGWDGKFKGQLCDEGIYVWKLHAVSESRASRNGGVLEKNLTGEILLCR